MARRKVRWIGGGRVRRQIGLIARKNPRWNAQFQFIEAEKIMAAAKIITPVDTGRLRASGHVDPPKIVKKRVFVAMGFGGPAAGYALIVHETPPPGQGTGGRTARHRPPTQWKFLEVPFLAAKSGMLARQAKFLLKKMQRLRPPPPPPGAKGR